jgi:Arc/MetJ-type ribon-helix-helix transcriptional regulator
MLVEGAAMEILLLKADTAMVIELKPEQQRIIDLAIQSGAYQTTDDVIDTALSMLAEDIEDMAVSDARSPEPRFTLAEVQAKLRALGKLK